MYRTKLAQVYPHELCDVLAGTVEVLKTQQHSIAALPVPMLVDPLPGSLMDPVATAPCSPVLVGSAGPVDPLELGSSDLDGQQFARTFAMKVPAAETKRPVGRPCRFR